MADKRKVAILGGSFNPITEGHIQLAEYVLNHTDIEKVWLTPCFSHVWDKELIDSSRRLWMCMLAANKNMRVCDIEINNTITTGTYDFLKILLDHYSNIDFSYIIGMDNANQFDKWKKADILKKMVRFIVVSRQGIPQNDENQWYTKPPHLFLNAGRDIMPVSSTLVRKLIKENKLLDVNKFVCPSVLNYIMEYKLYGFS